jgi:hypothetical protein
VAEAVEHKVELVVQAQVAPVEVEQEVLQARDLQQHQRLLIQAVVEVESKVALEHQVRAVRAL